MLSCIYNKYFLSGLLFILIGQFILCLDYSFFLDILYSGTRFLIFGILLIEFLKSPKTSYIDKYFIYFFLVLLLTTLLNCPYRLIQFVSNFINVFCVIFLFNLCPQKSITTLIKVLSNVFSFYIYANFILLIVYPDGLWMSANGVSQYLIGGNYNQMGLALIVGNVSNIIYSMLLRKKTINSICCFIISIATVIFLGSMTATLGLVILGLFLPFMSRNIARGLILFFLLFVVSFYFFVI